MSTSQIYRNNAPLRRTVKLGCGNVLDKRAATP
jgi:hypothetical protein